MSEILGKALLIVLGDDFRLPHSNLKGQISYDTSRKKISNPGLCDC
jgi:hypothetical protein